MAQAPAFESDGAKALRGIAALVNKGDFPGALSRINSELAIERSPVQKGKLLGQAARTLYKRGRYTEAAATFRQATEIAIAHPRAWYPLKLANVDALLKQASVSEAIAEANACYSIAESKLQEFEAARATATTQFARTGLATVPIKPIRLSVVASELGNAFLREGELETAKGFYERAIIGNSRGGTRARQGLAEIALRMDDPENGFQRAVEALTLGKFQAKTIASWKLLFAAKRKFGQKGIPAELLASVKACKPSVRARIILTIVRELRSVNDPQWISIARDWLAAGGKNFPSVAAELSKLLVADSKLALDNPKLQAENAQNLLSTDLLAPHEWLAGAKEYVRAKLFANQSPDIPQLAAQATVRYGAAFVPQLKHSLALSCMMAKRHDLARPLLLSAIAETAGIKNHIWSKALWALGRMEAFLRNYPKAVVAYGALANEEKVPIKFRLQARVLWLNTLLTMGDQVDLDLINSDFLQSLAAITDYELLLNFAQQLTKSRADLRDTAEKVFQLGRIAALQAFNTASHPSVALEALFKLTRRTLYDFDGKREVIAFWEKLGADKEAWLWSNNNYWWGYLSLVLQAYIRGDDKKGADQLASKLFNDPAVPRAALAEIFVPYYEALIEQGNPSEGLKGFTWVVTESPSQAGCATAYYWLGLAAWKAGDKVKVLECVHLAFISNAHTKIIYDQWLINASLLLLQANMQEEGIPAQAVEFDKSFIAKAKSRIRTDLKLL